MTTFYVTPVWDAEAQVYYSSSNIIGLHIEAATIGEFNEIAASLAPDLIGENH
ncbi:DUF1902 domain-containing protein [Sulfitobacter sp. CS16]|uniref:DUF1902 domain-containing protein n=1 Tax=Sulfitobacter sp. CS16 TaxID=3368573 RepID=UPI003746DA4B